MDKEAVIIGRSEEVTLLTQGVSGVPARIDTGAKTSSLWVSDVQVHGTALSYVLFGPASPLYTGEVLKTTQFTKLLVANSTGQVYERYAIEMTVKLGGRTITALFTLADRSMQLYPVLVGRNLLVAGNFLVDVKRGKLPQHGTAHAKQKFVQHVNGKGEAV